MNEPGAMRESWKESIIKVVEQCPEVERVRLFGSRAKATLRDHIDRVGIEWLTRR